MSRASLAGHAAALFSILVWGGTFISTKVLLEGLSPVEILFCRFLLGWIALWAAWPRRLRITEARHEALFALAGLTGVTLYFLFENIALTFSPASSVGVIVTVAPCLTALAAWLILGAPRPGALFFTGFALAMTGVALISFNGARVFSLNPAGDALALGAALVWALYSLLTRAISARGYPSLPATRRIFFYGLLFMLPCLPLFGFSPAPGRLLSPAILGNLLFLGLLASAACFAAWTFAVERLGPTLASLYIYLVPVVTVAASIAILRERLTPLSGLGCLLAVCGLILSGLGKPAARPNPKREI